MKSLHVLLAGVILVLLTAFAGADRKKLRQKNDNFVPDAETARKIAEAIWLPIYGKQIYEDTPFIAKLNRSDVWVVEGTLKDGLAGGVPYIEIEKNDCKILKVSHGK
jgi:hypothetical protein